MNNSSQDLVYDMIQSCRLELEKDWDKVSHFLAIELQKLSECLDMIEQLWEKNLITESQAKTYLNIQKQASEAVLVDTIKVLSQHKVRKVLTNALKVVRNITRAKIIKILLT